MRTTTALTLFLAACATTTNAFTTITPATRQQHVALTKTFVSTDESEKATEAVFMPPEEEGESSSAAAAEDESIPLDTVEKLGKGAAKVRKKNLIVLLKKKYQDEFLSPHFVSLFKTKQCNLLWIFSSNLFVFFCRPNVVNVREVKLDQHHLLKNLKHH